jgi:hypothetical protein
VNLCFQYWFCILRRNLMCSLIISLNFDSLGYRALIQEVMYPRISGILNSRVLMSDDLREWNFGGSRKPSQRCHLKSPGLRSELVAGL